MAHMSLNLRRKRQLLKGNTAPEPVYSAATRCYHKISFLFSRTLYTTSPSQQNVELLACLPLMPCMTTGAPIPPLNGEDTPHCLYSEEYELLFSVLHGREGGRIHPPWLATVARVERLVVSPCTSVTQRGYGVVSAPLDVQ